MNLIRTWVRIITAGLAGFLLVAHAETETLYCGQRAYLAGQGGGEPLKYAPDPGVQILHLAIDVTPDFKDQRIEGKVTLRFKPTAQSFQELRLDGVDLLVHSVTASEKIMGWQATDKQVITTFAQPIPPQRETTLTITYQAHPREGLYFRIPEMGYKAEDMHLWTQGESEFARYWFPSFDAPNQKFTSEVTCRVAEGMEVLSNGKLMSKEKDAGSGLVAVRWLQDKPHVNYLIFLAAGYFKKVEDRYKDVPLAFYTPASRIDLAPHSFQGTKDMMEFFEKEIGVPYPWAKYDQVCVDDFTAGGMENTSITALNDGTLHNGEFENLRDSQGLVAHELSHQWFGDLVTCKDWANLWLNEGFATYYEHLYDGYKHGQDTLLLRMYQGAKHLLSQASTNAMVRRNYDKPDELFDSLAYGKGAWILHMLRSQLGPELYRRGIKTYLERFQYKNATTEDLKKVLEEVSGQSFDQFFDQWVYRAAQPELSINYSWDEKAKLAKITVQQTQKEGVLLAFPLPVRFKMKNSTALERTLQVKAKTEDFYFPLAEAPELFRIDPELTVLAKINYNPSTAMLYTQLADKSDAMGRLLAVEQLSGKKEALGKLKEVLNNDSFYAVRMAASRALRAIQADEALEALLASTRQEDARVRRQVVADFSGFYRGKSCQAALKIALEEKNPDIRAAAITSLGAYSKAELREKLLAGLNTASFRNVLGDAAIQAMRAQGDPVYIEPILQALEKGSSDFSTGGLGKAMESLAWLARNEENKTAVREFLLAQLTSKKKRVRVAAINALGTLGDPKAIGALDTFADGPKESSECRAAEKAVAALREGKKPSAELGGLRSEVLELQKENRELRKEMDEVKRRFEALTKPSSPKGKPVAPARWN